MVNKYRVGVSNETVTTGIGPALIEAVNGEAAKLAFAEAEGFTIEQLADRGLTWWQVDKLPSK